MTKNRLKLSSSPYLLQHANDPVHWQPWDDEALALARAENKPILLSIGYSACHWCHVMAHESFADERIARLMNEHFVNIKLDREERPDLDKVYQMTHQLLLQRPGGWPLTVFLTPDKHIPFFAGTYFPPETRNGMPAFPDILSRISEYFNKEGESIQAQGQQIKDFFDSFDQRELTPVSKLNNVPLTKAITLLQSEYDHQFGGFGGAPKFPFPSTLDLFLQQWAKTAYGDEPDRKLLFMASHTLQQMARGGLYDQIRGGFYRYCVDQAWMIPHFEKMLYDNAQLIPLYAQMFQISGDSFYRDVANDSVQWLLDEMQKGGQPEFFSTLDADSEGQEGKFYVWSREEIEDLLELEELHLVEEHFNLKEAPNFEGAYHLHQIADIAALAESMNTPRADVQKQLRTIKNKLLDYRNERVKPYCDHKLLTSWNALLANGLIISGRILDDTSIQKSAIDLLDSIKKDWDKNGCLSVQLGEHSHPKLAFLDEHAFTLEAIIQQLQTRWDKNLLSWAIDIAEVLIKDFMSDLGGFYYTSNQDPEKLLYRPLTFTDDALPSGNAVATRSLLRLGNLLGNTEYRKAAEKALQNSFLEMDKSPQAHATLLSVLDEYLEPGKQIIIRGELESINEWRHSLQKLYAPKLQIFAIPNSETDLPDAIHAKMMREITVAYVCEGTNYSEAIYEFDKLLEILQ